MAVRKKGNIIPTLKYMRITLIHKYYVFRAGLKLKVPLWNLIVHDFSKFTLSEAPHYGRHYFGDKSDPLGFAYAWNRHQKRNKHHWEYWVPETGHEKNHFVANGPLPIPEKYLREMLADWMGTERTHRGKWPQSRDEWKWLDENYHKIRLHQDTRNRLDEILEEAFK